MALVELFALTVGSAIAKSVFKIWLKDIPLVEAGAGSIVDFLASLGKDKFQKRRVQIKFEELAQKAAVTLSETLISQGQFPDKGEQTEIGQLVATTLEKADITAQLLTKCKLDPRVLSEHFISVSGDVEAELSLPGKNYYRQMLVLSAQYIVEMAANLPDFQQAVASDLLNGIGEVLEAADRLDNKFNSFERALVPIADDLLKHLEASSAAFELRNLPYRTSNLILALLNIPYSFSMRCFNQVEERIGLEIRQRISDNIHDSQIPIDSKNGLTFEPFNWKEREELKKASNEAIRENYPVITEKHVFLALLKMEPMSKTVQFIQKQLGKENFEKLRIIAMSQEPRQNSLIGGTPGFC